MALLFSRSASPHHGFAAYYTYLESIFKVPTHKMFKSTCAEPKYSSSQGTACSYSSGSVCISHGLTYLPRNGRYQARCELTLPLCCCDPGCTYTLFCCQASCTSFKSCLAAHAFMQIAADRCSIALWDVHHFDTILHTRVSQILPGRSCLHAYCCRQMQYCTLGRMDLWSSCQASKWACPGCAILTASSATSPTSTTTPPTTHQRRLLQRGGPTPTPSPT